MNSENGSGNSRDNELNNGASFGAGSSSSGTGHAGDWIRRGIFRVRPTWVHLPIHAEGKELFYGRIVVPALKLMMRAQNLQITVEGEENIPENGPALLAINHTGYFDFILSGTLANLRGHRLVRFMAKQELFKVPALRLILKAMGHIPVDRSAGAAAMDAAVRDLRAGKLVGIFPEGTISRSFEIKELKTGAVRIAQQAGVPLLPVAIWGSQRILSKGTKRNLGRSGIPVWIKLGKPISTEGSVEEVTARLRSAMQELLNDVRQGYERAYGPFAGGEDWLPASMGGTAPTPEEALKIDAELRAQREAAKAAKAAQAAQGSKKPNPLRKLLRKLR